MDAIQTIAALRALAHETRLAAFRLLVEAGHDGMAVGELRERLDIPPATLTAHLNVLRGAGLVADAREGRSIRVRADFARMDALLAYLTDNCCQGAACTPQRGGRC
jgi:DNA-binding transcriptional ArsR family regulator